MKRLLLPALALLAAGGPLAAAGPPPVRLWLETSTHERQLIVVPHLDAPAGTRFRYEVTASKGGPSGTTSTNQSGEVAVDASGTAALSRLALGLGADDRCNVAVRVYDGGRIVAEELFHVPE